MSILDEQIGKILQGRRLELGLSFLAVATKLNIDAELYCRYEEGAERISAVHLVMLTDVLQIALADIFLNLPPFDASATSNEQIAALLQGFRRIRNNEIRRFLIGLSEDLARSTTGHGQSELSN